MPIRLIILTVLLLPASVIACLWDKDTLEMERQKVPSALEVITGKFLRHSDAYYHWRIKDRESRLEELNIDAFLKTDLAVAYFKLGDIDRAIEIQLEVEEKNPGQYESYANLATFYIESGQYDEGIKFVEKAMEINADAHFGRAIYQKLLAMYLKLRIEEDGGTLNLPLKRKDSKMNIVKFRDYIGVTEPVDEELQDRDVYISTFHSFVSFYFNHHGEGYESTEAIMGMVGILRFADHTSPILLEAIGDLLSKDGYEGEQRLSARAYLKASYAVSDETIKAEYQKLAQDILHSQVFGENREDNSAKLAVIAKAFAAELKESGEFFDEITGYETDWVDRGLDLDEEFKKVYLSEPAITSTIENKTSMRRIIVIGLFSIVLVIAGRRIIFRGKRDHWTSVD
ncbi:MAG: tetratricopeptide repeat protein [Pirellulaceae bacterium]